MTLKELATASSDNSQNLSLNISKLFQLLHDKASTVFLDSEIDLVLMNIEKEAKAGSEYSEEIDQRIKYSEHLPTVKETTVITLREQA